MARAGRVTARRTPAEEMRPIRSRKYKHLVLIVCEDEATEPFYFRTVFSDVPPDTLYVRTVGAGRDPLGVAQRAVTERDLLAVEARLGMEARREVDEVWLVFDKDDADQNSGKTTRFYEAIALAEREKMKLAFSNEVFELWLLLHLVEVSSTEALSRAEVYARLSGALRRHADFADFVYDHTTTKATEVIPAVLKAGNESQAYARAAALLAAHGDNPLLETNPSTRVHLLVQELHEWIAYYRK